MVEEKVKLKNVFKNKENRIGIIFIVIVLVVLFYKNFDVPNFIKSINPQKGDFIKVGKMSKPRSNHEAILLDDGNVLVLGGGNKNAEIYNFKTKKFTTVGMMLPFTGHKNLTKLNNGKVLITGGDLGYAQKTTQFYNPEIKNFEEGPDMNYPRAEETATLLKDGRVLIVGGDNVYYLDKRNVSNEIYNPKTNKFELAPKTNIPRFSHSAILLKDGRVLIVGGSTKGAKLLNAEIYNPKTNKFESAGNINIARVHPNLYLLKNGKVVITSHFDKEIEEYTPLATGFKIITKRDLSAKMPAETKLSDDKIIFLGGCSGVGLSLTCYTSSEIFDPKTMTFVKSGNMNYQRECHKATLLQDGNVLITGSTGTGRTAELYISK